MQYYYLILAFHLISVVLWISVIVYMQRLILLQAEGKNDKLQEEAFFIYKKIASPAFLGTVVFGILLVIFNKAILESGFWIYAKFFLISLIILMHHLSKINLMQIENNTLTTSKKQIGYHSYSPLILLSLVVILTIIKPF